MPSAGWPAIVADIQHRWAIQPLLRARLRGFLAEAGFALRPARLRCSQAAFLFTSSFKHWHQMAAIVRQMPAVSAGGKSANGQS
jgi:hypothetical protein